MTKIERTSVMESALDDTEVPTIPLSDTDSVYSLPHLVSKINPQDRKFLKYLPDQMLSNEQIVAKSLALKEDKAKLDAISDVECYKLANVDKKTFSKIKCNKNYKPSKITAVSFAIALRLDLEETNQLLKTVGMSLSRSNKFDVIIEYFITTGDYKNIFDVNETLYQFDQTTLGV